MSFLPAGSKFNTGTNRSIVIVNDATNATVVLGGRLNKVTERSKDKLLEGEGIDQGGRVFHQNIPGGGEGTITVERANGNSDRFKAFLDSQFYAGQGTPTFTITEKTQNAYDSSVDTATYTKVVFHNYRSGEWDRSNKVMVELDFAYTEKLPV